MKKICLQPSSRKKKKKKIKKNLLRKKMCVCQCVGVEIVIYCNGLIRKNEKKYTKETLLLFF